MRSTAPRARLSFLPLSTGQTPRPPIVVAIPSAGPNAVAVCDQLRAVDKSGLTQASGRLSTANLRVIEKDARRILQL
jgi:mRNA interferase MazF